MRHGLTILTLSPSYKVKDGNILPSPPPVRFHTIGSAGKVMASVFWDSEGLLMIDHISAVTTAAIRDCSFELLNHPPYSPDL